jgi:dTDP-4-dehydrorhamnose reductase
LAPLGEVTTTTRDGALSGGGSCEALDLSDLEAIGATVSRLSPDIVVNATAYTAVDRAEEERALAFRINAEAPGRLAAACASLGVPLLHYSTDYVFDGNGSRPYLESDPTAPLGVYGESKLAGERAVQDSGARHLIVRTAWVYAMHGHNFLRTMLRLAGERDELRVVADQLGSPTPAWLIADATAAIIDHGLVEDGVRHLTSTGETSWHGFAQAIVEQAAADGTLSSTPRVTPISTREYPTPAARPTYSVLDTRRLEGEYGLTLPGWRDALRRTMDSSPAD